MIKVKVSELRVPLFYICDEKKFWHYLNNLLNSKTQSEHWLKVIIRQTFFNDWRCEPFAPKAFPRIMSHCEASKHRQDWKETKKSLQRSLKEET